MSAALDVRKYTDGKTWGVFATMPNGKAGFIPADADNRKVDHEQWIATLIRLLDGDPIPATLPELRALTVLTNEEFKCLTSHDARRLGDPLVASVPDYTGDRNGWCDRCYLALPSEVEARS